MGVASLKAVKDPIGGYRVKGTEIIWARVNECTCCWYVLDQSEMETLGYTNSYASAKTLAFNYVTEKEAN